MWALSKWLACGASSRKNWLSEEVFQNIRHIQTYNWTKYALCENSLRGGLQGQAMAFRSSFLKHFTHPNIQLDKVCALWKYTECWISSRSKGSQEKFIKALYTFKHTIEQSMRSVKAHWVVGFKQKQWLPGEVYSKHFTHPNIQLDKECALWKYSGWWASSRSNGFQKKFFKTSYTFTHIIEQSMRSVKLHWLMGFKQKQWLAEKKFQNIKHSQTYNWTKYALCENTLSGGLQSEAMAFRRIFSKQYTHSNIQLNEVYALWKHTECWASSRSNGFPKKFFETIYTSKHTIEQSMRSVKVHWVLDFKQKQRLAGEVLQSIIHIQTYNWTKYAVCESTLSGGLQAEAMASRRSFSKHFTHPNIQLDKVCALWKYTECWISSRSKGSQEKFIKALYTFKHTIEQSMRSVKAHWVVGFKQKQWLPGEVYSKHFTHPNIQLDKECALWKYSGWWASSRSNGFQKKFFKTSYTFTHIIEQSMRSVKLHWVMGFKQKQWLAEKKFQNIKHSQTYNWTKYALCENTLSGGLQSEAMAFRRIFSKQYTHSNIQLNEVYALWKHTECWASSRSNGFPKKFFETIYTSKHTIEQSMRSVKVHWVLDFKQKQRLAGEVLQSIIHIQTYNWTKYAVCESTLSGGLQAEAMASRRSFSKHFTHPNIQLDKVCALWKYTECWISSRSKGSQEKFIKALYTFKHTIEQSMRSVEAHWVVGFKQKQWLPGEVYSKHFTHPNIQLDKECALWKYSGWWASSRSNGFQKKFFKTSYTFTHIIEQSMRSVKVQWVVGFKQKQWLSDEFFRNIIQIQTYNWTKYALCESTLRGELQGEAMAFRSSFLMIIHIQTYNWKIVSSVKVTWVVGFKQKKMAFRRSFSKHYTHSNIQLNKACTLGKYSGWWVSIRSNGFQKKFFETLYTFKHSIEQSMRSVKVQWVVGFKQKQGLPEEVFQNIIHIQTYNWTKYALCERTLSGGLQAEKNGFQK